MDNASRGPEPSAVETRRLAERLAVLTPFTGVALEDLARLSRGARHRRLKAGETLWRSHERADHFAVVEAGVVQIRQTTSAGDGILLGLFRAGDVVGLSAALEGNVFPADAIAMGGGVELVSIRAEALRNVLAHSVAVARAVNLALLEHTAALRAKIDIVSAGSVPRRLAALMSYLIERFGTPIGTDTFFVELSLSREDIGQAVSARAETVIRILSRWHKAGWIADRPGGVVITRADMLQRILRI